MANKPFDQRVINQLERPTSRDLNIAQSQINLGTRALARQLLMSNPAFVPRGALGESFFVEAVGGRNVLINRGIGFNYAAYDPGTDMDIGAPGITGLSDPLDYRLVSLQSEAGVTLTVPVGPGAGLCRRDVIAIRCTNPATDQLEDYADTDIYDPYYNKFSAVSKPKTFTYDLTGAVPQVLNYTQIGSATAAVVYITGETFAYTGPDSLLSATAPTIGTGAYINTAIINVVQSLPTIATSDIVDFRRLVAPQGNLVVSGSATIGSSGSSPGARLDGVTLKTPPGIKAQIWKVAPNISNSYAIVVYGPRSVTAASLTLQRGDPADRYDSLVNGVFGFSDRPISLVFGPHQINSGVNNLAKTTAASSSAAPAQQIAIGQPYHVFPFTLCRVENETSTVTEPLTLTLDLDPITIPNSTADLWPAGTYSAAGHTNYRTFYLQANTAPALPTSNLPPTTYLLSDTLNNTAEHVIEVNDIGETYQRVVGFVANQQPLTWGNGIWRLSLSAIGLPFSGVGMGVAPISAVARVYSYNGSTNPESGTLLASSPDTLLPNSFAYANQPEFVDFYIDEIGGGTYTTNRLYIVIYVKKTTSFYNGYARFYFNYGDNKAAFLETNILAAAPTVTIPNKADRWPAGVSLQPTGTAESTPVTLSVAGQQQRLNPSALVSDIPINFTLNLTVE